MGLNACGVLFYGFIWLLENISGVFFIFVALLDAHFHLVQTAQDALLNYVEIIWECFHFLVNIWKLIKSLFLLLYPEVHLLNRIWLNS